MIEIEDQIINKVANSGLITIDLEDFSPVGERVLIDLKDNLFMGLILREKDFREFLKTNDWSQYQGKNVAITCTEDVIIPTWAYMLLVSKLQPIARNIVFGDLQKLEETLFQESIKNIDVEKYRDAKVVVKGCSKGEVPTAIYVSITKMLMPVAQSIMFGEPCSTVPVFKRPKT
jgi:Protein of unknown function (DUF2480)